MCSRAHGIPIAAARDEHEAFAAFLWAPPAVVLTDILLAERCHTAMAMRSARPRVKIVAMSDGRVRKSDFLTIAKNCCADAIVHKPFEVSELVKLLRTFVHRRK